VRCGRIPGRTWCGWGDPRCWTSDGPLAGRNPPGDHRAGRGLRVPGLRSATAVDRCPPLHALERGWHDVGRQRCSPVPAPPHLSPPTTMGGRHRGGPTDHPEIGRGDLHHPAMACGGSSNLTGARLRLWSSPRGRSRRCSPTSSRRPRRRGHVRGWRPRTPRSGRHQFPVSGAGRRPAQGRAASSWPARRNSVASSPKRPSTCTPMGRPAPFHQSGTDMAGLPVMLATTAE